jgi:glycerol-3-phosphate dehydrogenase
VSTRRGVDVAIVGGGVVGAAVAWALAHTELDVVLLEARRDLGAGTSKANTAILHTGFDAAPGSMESRLVRRGYELLQRYCTSANIAVEPLGALLVAWDDDQLAALSSLQDKANANGVEDTEIVSADEVAHLEPHLGAGALGALRVPGEGIIDPWTVPLALATEAAVNGVAIRTNAQVTAVATAGSEHVLSVTGGDVVARVVVNAAGLHGDRLHRWFGHDSFTVVPRRGQLIVFDKLARSLVQHVLLPVPTALGKGVLVSPTVFGNVMVGPTAEPLEGDDARTATETTADGLATLMAHAARIVPALAHEEVTATYAGLRAATEHSDYCIEAHEQQGYVCLGGIRSTGLTAALAIAEHVVHLLGAMGIELVARDEVLPVTMPNLGEAFPRPYEMGGAIACHCERVTVDELHAAVRSPMPAVDLDGLRRRTRAGAGRCQGFHCLASCTQVLRERAAGTP